ncbi:enoyl-CoA hydratase/isomerase family protein [Brucella tritici]|uniref:Enoyl-CoA hydratase/isomerase family protein n=1 Tax=Brucella tritici TaxID=94626 RepID=A0A7V7VR97_9HYPH|nr:enoyl-CoA hydratase/isomerase family protein [Brucella tritici]KAB2655213.1 enoyl-CoA hydratase/isomerase family protein [Brucella tritici]
MFEVERNGEVAIIRLNNPPVNAVSFGNWDRLPPLLNQLVSDGVGALVFSGHPQKHFCGGNDFREFNTLTPEQTLAGTGAVQNAMRAVRDCALPSIAAIHGAAMGSGFMLSCACDIRLATPDSRLGLPEVKVGAIGGYRIAREVLCQSEARMMVMTGEPISGQRAHQIGLVQELQDSADLLLARAIAMAGQIASLMTGELRSQLKTCMNAEDENALWIAYDMERDLAAKVMGTSRNQ